MKKLLFFKKLKRIQGPILLFILLLSGFNALAQNKAINGKVSGEDGLGLPGVSVKVKGTTIGTLTDGSGRYKISVPPTGTLEFSYLGYTTSELPIGSDNIYNITLAATTKQLNEVTVVSIGYGNSKKTDLTGSISSINAATIAKVPVTTVEQALQGRAAGVQVTNNDASPGGNVTVLVRGTGSLASGGNNPLYIVDGYPFQGGINNINPSDIASIDVLKDASATAIYGIRAANGVVIINTKRGRKDGVQISVDAYSAFQSKPKEYKVLNAFDWGTLANQVAAADLQHNFTELPIWKTPSALTNADWQNAVYRVGQTQNYSLAIRGGNEKVQSAVSFGFYDQKGIVLGSYFKRLTLGVNLDYQAKSWLKSATNVKYTYQDANNPFGTGSLVQLSQLVPTLDSGNKVTNLIKDNKGNYGFYNPQNTYVAKYGNPVFTIEQNQYQNITNFLLANSSLEATIFDGLKVRTNAGVNLSQYSGSFYQPQDDRSDQQYGLGGATQNAFYSQHLYNSFEWLWENTLSYDKQFGKHAINFIAGVSAQKTTNDFMGGSGIPPNSSIRDLSQVSNLKLDGYNSSGGPGNGQTITTLESQFARLTYKYGDKYLITGTVRRDGSSKFDVGHQYGVFPTGAVAWKAKEENFLKDVNWLNDLKFRGSYGKVGNQGPIGLYQYQAAFSTGSAPATSGNLGYPFGKNGSGNGTYQPGDAEAQPANPNLRWETDYQTDIGMDAAFLKGELNVTVDYYHRKSKDFLLNLAAPAQSGHLSLTQNVGSMLNTGLEFALNYNHQVNKDFHFGTALTLSFIKNKLTSLISGANFVTNFGGLSVAGIGWSTFTETNIGQPVGEFYGYKTNGIFQTQAQIDALNATAAAKNPSNPYYQFAATAPGDRYFVDTKGDGQVTTNSQVSLGSPIPKFFGGLNLDFSYKNWDFNAYFYGVYGNKILNYEESSLESFQNRSFVGVENVSQDYFKNRWTSTNPSNKYAQAKYNDDAVGSNVPSDRWIEDGSFLKLKNLTIGYTIPTDVTKKLFVKKIRIYGATQNLFTITKYSGLDPEIGLQNGNATQNGVDSGTYPSSKYYTIGLNLTF